MDHRGADRGHRSGHTRYGYWSWYQRGRHHLGCRSHHHPSSWWFLRRRCQTHNPWTLCWHWRRNGIPFYRHWLHRPYHRWLPSRSLRWVPFYGCRGVSWFLSWSAPWWGGTTVVYRDVVAESSASVVYEDGGTGQVEPVPGRVVSNRQPVSNTSLAQRYVDLADGYFVDGRYVEAAESYLRALTYAPDSPSLYFALADALFAIGDYHYAAYAIRKGVVLEPVLARSGADKRAFYEDKGLFTKQLATLEKWVRTHPRDGDAWLVLGYNQLFSGDLRGARLSFRRAAELVPDDQATGLFILAVKLHEENRAAPAVR